VLQGTRQLREQPVYFKVSVFEDVLDVFLLGYFAKKKNRNNTLCEKKNRFILRCVVLFIFILLKFFEKFKELLK
jgi:hypothetical protein